MSTTGTSGGCYLKFNETLPSNFSIELELTGITYLSSGLGGGFSVENTFIELRKTKTGFHNQDAHDYNVIFSSGDIVKITSNNGTISLYKNNVLIASNTSTVTGFEGFSVRNVGACGVSFKNLKIHEL